MKRLSVSTEKGLTNQPPGIKMEVKKKMEERKMATVPSNQQWKKENTVMVGVRLMKKTDMDIINALQTEGTKQERLRDLLRKGIAYEQLLNEQKTE